jgi:hypothetical protein
VVVSPVVRLVFSPAPAVNSADVDDKAMAAIGQRVVAEAPCVALEVVAEEQVFEAIDIPVVPIEIGIQQIKLSIHTIREILQNFIYFILVINL